MIENNEISFNKDKYNIPKWFKNRYKDEKELIELVNYLYGRTTTKLHESKHKHLKRHITKLMPNLHRETKWKRTYCH